MQVDDLTRAGQVVYRAIEVRDNVQVEAALVKDHGSGGAAYKIRGKIRHAIRGGNLGKHQRSNAEQNVLPSVRQALTDAALAAGWTHQDGVFYPPPA